MVSPHRPSDLAADAGPRSSSGPPVPAPRLPPSYGCPSERAGPLKRLGGGSRISRDPHWDTRVAQEGLADGAEKHSGQPPVPVRSNDEEGRASGLLQERGHRAPGNGPRDDVDLGVSLGPSGKGFGQNTGGSPVVLDTVSGVDHPRVGQLGVGMDGGQPAAPPGRLVERESHRRRGGRRSVDTDNDTPGARAGVASPSAGVRATMTGHGACVVTWVATDPSPIRDGSNLCPEPRTSTRASMAALTSCSATWLGLTSW